jgi:hypothetical protein
VSASVVPFPLIKRVHFVRRTAARVAEASPKTAEKLLAVAIQQQADTLTRKGVAPNLIAREVKALESALRAQLWHLILRRPPGGAA